MNRYQPALPRVAISLAAISLPALTLGLAVLPAQLGSVGTESCIDATPRPVAPMAATGGSAPILVHGVREQRTAFEPVRHDLRVGEKQADRSVFPGVGCSPRQATAEGPGV